MCFGHNLNGKDILFFLMTAWRQRAGVDIFLFVLAPPYDVIGPYFCAQLNSSAEGSITMRMGGIFFLLELL